MFSWFKNLISKNVLENNPQKEIVEIDNYENDRAFFEEKNKEKIEEYEKRLHTDSKFREWDIVKSIYPNSPEMLVVLSKSFNYYIDQKRKTNKFEKDNTITTIRDYVFGFYITEPEIYVKYHDSNFQLVAGKFKEEELILVSRKEV